MSKVKIQDYDLTIMNFVADVNGWLKDRLPNRNEYEYEYEGGRNIVHDDTDKKDVVDTMEMWSHVMADPFKYTEYGNLYGYVCNHERGFSVKRGFNQYDNSMLIAVNDVLVAIGNYYQVKGDYQKQELAKAIKKYKVLRAENIFERLRVTLTNPQNLLSTKQR